MSNMHNKTAFGAVFATIVAFCRMLIGLFSVAEDGVAILQKSVETQRKRQVVDLAISESNYITRVVAKAALEQARQQKTLDEYAQGSEEDAKRLKANLDRLTGIVNKELANLEIKEEEA